MEFIQWTKGKEKLCLPISYLCDPISYVKDKDAAGLSTSKLKFKWRHPLITPGIANLIREHFELSTAEADEILNVADDEAERAVSLHDFTRLLHDTLEPREKHEVIEMLWRVAYADTRLDKYEDHFVRKVADLLYVSHQDLVRIRHKVKGGK